MVLLWLLSNFGWAQNDRIVVEKITMEGNRRTREEIVLRELKFRTGDTVMISALEKLLEESEQLVMNTGLFNSANIIIKNWRGADNHVHFHLELAETWYIYPIPIFELADRNFNVWWVEQNRSLQRINFGIQFTHLNFSGRRDRLLLIAQYGYTRKYAMQYTLPYFNKAQTLGVDAVLSFSQNREVNYASQENKQAFYSNKERRFTYQQFHLSFDFSYRPGFHRFHNVEVAFRQKWVDPFVANELNPDFFLDRRSRQRSVSLAYRFTFDRRDVQAYPLAGTYLNASLTKTGLGVFSDRNALGVEFYYQRYLSLSQKWSTGLLLGSKAELIRKRQPFVDYRALGYQENTLYGYEYYIVNGLDMGLARGFLRYRLLEKGITFGKLMPIAAFRNMPVKVYLSLNQGAAYVNDPYTGAANPFANRMLWGGGIGLDIVLYYDKVLQIQYSYNHLWEKGLFLHFSANI
jgi:outer membrane protein assembly factor BamA